MKNKKKLRRIKQNYKNRVRNKEKALIKVNTTQEKLNTYTTAFIAANVGYFLFTKGVNTKLLKNITSIKNQVKIYAKNNGCVLSENILVDFSTAKNIELSIKNGNKFLAIGHTSKALQDNFFKYIRYNVV